MCWCNCIWCRIRARLRVGECGLLASCYNLHTLGQVESGNYEEHNMTSLAMHISVEMCMCELVCLVVLFVEENVKCYEFVLMFSFHGGSMIAWANLPTQFGIGVGQYHMLQLIHCKSWREIALRDHHGCQLKGVLWFAQSCHFNVLATLNTSIYIHPFPCSRH